MPLLVLSAADVAHVSSTFTPHVLTALMALVFVRLTSRTGVASPHRVSIEAVHHTALFMPSRIHEFGTAVKVVSVPKSRPNINVNLADNTTAASRRGLPASTLVLDEETGAVKALVNATSLTALRNAAGTTLATQVLGPQHPRVLLAFGAGRQIEAHLNLLIRTFSSLKTCIIVNRSQNSRLESLLSRLRTNYPDIHFFYEIAVDGIGYGIFDLTHAVSSADIICTATSSTKPLFDSSWVKIGTHINLVGSYTRDMVEVDNELILRAGKIVVDSREACAVEAGELISAGMTGDDMVELGELIHVDGRELEDEVMRVRAAGDVTIFKSVGVGLQDVAIASVIVDKAMSMSIGTLIENYD